MGWKTDETRQKMLSILSYNARQPRKNKVKRSPTPLHVKEKISLSLKGYKHTEQAKKNMGQSRIGIKHTEERNKKIGDAQKGEKNHLWKGGISWQYKMKNHPDYSLAMSVKSDRCDICKVLEKDLKRKLSFDHNHETGKFRGWLCGKCNSGLGFVKDNPKILKSMIKYLKNNL